MREVRTPLPGAPGEPPPAPPVPPPPSGRSTLRGRTRRGSRRQRTTVAAIGFAAVALGAAGPGAAAIAPVGVLLRQARYALASGDAERARTALLSACEAGPGSARGIEAALLLASLEFGQGDRAAAEGALARASGAARSLPGAALSISMARGWLALASDEPAAARAAFQFSTSSSEPGLRDLSLIGTAWASLVAGEPAVAIPPLDEVARASKDPVLRVAAGWSLARAHAARGDQRRARHALRSLRRLARGTSFADDVELALAVSELDEGRFGSARRTALRLRSLPSRTSGPAGRPGERASFEDLRLPPRGLVGRLAVIFASRPDPAEAPSEFLRRALDRDARADATEVLRIVSEKEGGSR